MCLGSTHYVLIPEYPFPRPIGAQHPLFLYLYGAVHPLFLLLNGAVHPLFLLLNGAVHPLFLYLYGAQHPLFLALFLPGVGVFWPSLPVRPSLGYLG